MKKLLFSAYNLDIGGIETALVTLLNTLVKEGYSITLSLEEKKGIFLNTIDKRITVVENCPSSNKNIIVRKTINFIQKIKLFKTYKNKFDFSASFATYSNMGSFLARISSKNSYLWGHADYLTLFNNNKKLMKKFFSQKKINKFRKIVFVSNEGKESFVKVFPKMKDKTIVLNNIINAKKILNLSSEKIDIDKLNIPTFVNIGRHDERQKKLSRIIEAAKILKDKKYKFRVILVGDGNDTSYYKELVSKYELEEYILFMGRKQNPYPYYKIADCIILTSDYEGYPVVFMESKILNKPIITTKVSDYQEIDKNYGIVVNKDIDEITKAMEQIINNGFNIKEKFDYEKYNNTILCKVKHLIGD